MTENKKYGNRPVLFFDVEWVPFYRCRTFHFFFDAERSFSSTKERSFLWKALKNNSLLTWQPCPWPPLGWTRPPGRDIPTARTLEGELHGASLRPSPEQIR